MCSKYFLPYKLYWIKLGDCVFQIYILIDFFLPILPITEGSVLNYTIYYDCGSVHFFLDLSIFLSKYF